MSDYRVDWLPTLSSPELVEKANQVVKEIMDSREDNQRGASDTTRTTKYQHIALRVISALYQAHFDSDSVSYPLKTSAYHKSKPGKVHLSHEYSTDVYEKLIGLGWITVTGAPVAKEKYTTIAAAGALDRFFSDLGLRWMPQEPLPDVLRDVKRDSDGIPKRSPKSKKTTKTDLVTPDNEVVAQYRENLREINALLIQHCISIDLKNDNFMALQQELSNRTEDADSFRSLQLHRVQLVRIFARGSLSKGGRFYRGWWQSIPATHRPHLRIDGKKVVEVDYSGISIRICNALLGKPLNVDSDPYDIGLADWIPKEDPRRKTLKKVINAMINDEDGIYRISKTDTETLGVDENEIRRLFKATHPELYRELGNGIGLKSQFVDSQIAEQVMLRMLKEGTVCLPIHDSFIVRIGEQHRLCTVMKEEFRKQTSADTTVDVDGIKVNEHFGMKTKDVEELSKQPYAGLVDNDKLMKSVMEYDQQITNRFVSYWERWVIATGRLWVD